VSSFITLESCRAILPAHKWQRCSPIRGNTWCVVSRIRFCFRAVVAPIAVENELLASSSRLLPRSVWFAWTNTDVRADLCALFAGKTDGCKVALKRRRRQRRRRHTQLCNGWRQRVCAGARKRAAALCHHGRIFCLHVDEAALSESESKRA